MKTPASLVLLQTLLALFLSSSVLPTPSAFTPPPASFFGLAGCTSAQRCMSAFSRPLYAESSRTSSTGGDFSFNNLERELRRRRVEEAKAFNEREETAAATAAAAAAVAKGAAAASSMSGLEEGDAFMEEQMVLRKTLSTAYVLVYNQGEPEEGVYTLFVQGRNVLRAWQNKPEAARYALMLRAEDLPLGKPTELPMSQIIGFCKDNGVGLELVPTGRGLQPPSRNKPQFDFDCSSGRERSSGSRRLGEAGGSSDSLFTPQELAQIKKQFEQSLEGPDED